jgi:tRNA-specific 2-thiouridylase
MDLGATASPPGTTRACGSAGSCSSCGAAPTRKRIRATFLHRLTQAQLARTIFPVGELKKSEVRRIAAEARLPNHAKKDSTGICFIGERPFRDFLKRYLPREPGPIRTPEGKQIGEHMGLAFYTIGQRKGIGIGGTRGAESDAWYVAQKDLVENTLVVVQGHDHPLLMKRALAAQDASWISGDPPAEGSTHSGKTRYRQQDSTCFVTRSEDDEIALEFAQPQWAVTPGQSVVLYDGDQCLGGAVIA